MTPPPARSTQQRIQDTVHRLENDIDAWVASADPTTGTPYLVPLSFHWDGAAVIVATPSSSVTGRNLGASGRARVGVGTTRDVVLIEGVVTDVTPAEEIAAEAGDVFAERSGFDPRALSTPYAYYRIEARRIQAWREANELDGRELMRGGRWVA